MRDLGLMITMRAAGRLLCALSNELYLLRLIHNGTRRALPGDRIWTGSEVRSRAGLGFLRACNCEGYDIYFVPFAGVANAGHILVDLDTGGLAAVDRMRSDGFEPCAVVRTSPGRLQAWIRVSRSPVDALLATAISRRLARSYGGDPGSVGWNHVGRLAGFTNRKPQRRHGDGSAPWVTILHAAPGLATNAKLLLDTPVAGYLDQPGDPDLSFASIDPNEARAIYGGLVSRWRIPQRYPNTDWSIVDLWVVRHLLSQGVAAARVASIIRLASPGFPRRHADPGDYIRRTLARGAFSSFPRAV